MGSDPRRASTQAYAEAGPAMIAVVDKEVWIYRDHAKDRLCKTPLLWKAKIIASNGKGGLRLQVIYGRGNTSRPPELIFFSDTDTKWYRLKVHQIIGPYRMELWDHETDDLDENFQWPVSKPDASM